MSDLSSSATLGESGTSFFHHCYVSLNGGYLGTMAKFGPLANSDSFADVRGGVGEIDDPLLFGVISGIDACMIRSSGSVAGCH